MAGRDFCFSRGSPKGKSQGAVWGQQCHCSPQAGGSGSPLSPPPQGSVTRAQDIHPKGTSLAPHCSPSPGHARSLLQVPSVLAKHLPFPLPLVPQPGSTNPPCTHSLYSGQRRVCWAREVATPALTQTRHSPHRSSPNALSPQVFSLAPWLWIEGKEATAQRPRR